MIFHMRFIDDISAGRPGGADGSEQQEQRGKSSVSMVD